MRLALAVEVEDPAALARAMDELKEGEFTLADLSGKLDRERSPVDTEWLRRVTGVLTVLKQLRERYLGDGPEGARAALGMVHGTTGGDGWEVAYPYNPFPFPWTGHAGGASAALALGLYEGHMARMAEGFKAIRMAELELDERYNPEIHDLYFARFDWRELSAEEFLLCPPVVLAGSDRELYGAGLGGVSALLRSGKPVKLLCLDTGAYSHLAGALGEPRGEASAGGAGSHGAQRRQMTLLGMAHRAAFIAQGSLANLPHLLQSFAAGLGATRPALFNVYCSRLPAHGLGDDQAVRQSRLALESRAHPVFRFDPDAPGPLHERLSLEGNPAPEELWPAYELNHLDEHGAPQTLELPMTFADFAAAVPGLEHHFQLVGEETPEESLLPLDEFLELEPDEREEARPFIQALAAEGRLQRLLVSPALVDACMERKQYWETLRELTRRDIVPVDEEAISAEAREEMVVKVTERLLELVQNREGLSSALTRAAGLEGDGAADPGDSHA